MSSFAFIFTSVVFEVPLPYKLTDELALARATDAQLAKITPRLEIINQLLPWAHFPYSYDVVTTVEPTPDGESKRWDYYPIPREQWRFWVINCESRRNLDELSHAFLLQQEEIVVGMTMESNGILLSHSHTHAANLHYFNEIERIDKPHVRVGELYLAEVRRVFGLLLSAVQQGKFVAKAVDTFSELAGLSSKSVHQIVFSFAIIESLITHEPTGKKGDSINAQLRSKLPQLETRLTWKLDFSHFVRNPGETDVDFKQKIWRQLYAYRSDIAHGSTFIFQTDYPALNTHEHALSFLRDLTKLVLLAALEDPVFVEQLKAR
jgi:hypothetical protein